MTYSVSPEWLQDNNAVIVDVRFKLQDSEYGYHAYGESHIPGAFYLDLNKDLSGEPQQHGGNHPLPDLEEFAEKLGNLGIDERTAVVFYDETNEMYAARAWWLLHYLGHEKVYVLDGGFTAWKSAGYRITDEIPKTNPTTFMPHVAINQVVTMEEVKKRAKQVGTVLIDSRAPKRYTGEVEPLYDKRGHIPGAKNYFYQDVFTEDGAYKSTEDLLQHFSKLDKNAEIIVSCGSGVSACPNVLGLKTAGFTNVKLYVGSFSDWISYEDNALETGDN